MTDDINEMNYRAFLSGSEAWLAALRISDWEALLEYILRSKESEGVFESVRARVASVLETARSLHADHSFLLPELLELRSGKKCKVTYLSEEKQSEKRRYAPIIRLSGGWPPDAHTLKPGSRSWMGKLRIVNDRGETEGDLDFGVDMLEASEGSKSYCEAIAKFRSVFIYNRDVSFEARGKGIGLDLLEATDIVAKHADADFILGHLYPSDFRDKDALIRGHLKSGYTYFPSGPAEGYAIKGISRFGVEYLERFGKNHQ